MSLVTRIKQYVFAPKKKDTLLTYLGEDEGLDKAIKETEAKYGVKIDRRELLRRNADASWDKYESGLEGKVSGALSGAASLTGLAADFLYVASGGLGISLKLMANLAKTAIDLPKRLSYTGKTGKYHTLPVWLGKRALIRYLPFGNVLDYFFGEKKAFGRAMLYEAKNNVLKELKLYKPPVEAPQPIPLAERRKVLEEVLAQDRTARAA